VPHHSPPPPPHSGCTCAPPAAPCLSHRAPTSAAAGSGRRGEPPRARGAPSPSTPPAQPARGTQPPAARGTGISACHAAPCACSTTHHVPAPPGLQAPPLAALPPSAPWRRPSCIVPPTGNWPTPRRELPALSRARPHPHHERVPRPRPPRAFPRRLGQRSSCFTLACRVCTYTNRPPGRRATPVPQPQPQHYTRNPHRTPVEWRGVCVGQCFRGLSFFNLAPP
jgi:hypothetical protein